MCFFSLKTPHVFLQFWNLLSLNIAPSQSFSLSPGILVEVCWTCLSSILLNQFFFNHLFVTGGHILEDSSVFLTFSSATTELPSNSSLPPLTCTSLLSIYRVAFASEGCGSENHSAFIVAPLHFLFLCFNQAYCKLQMTVASNLAVFINFGILLVFFHNLYFLVCIFCYVNCVQHFFFLKHGPCMNPAAKNTSLPGDVSTFASLEI